MNRGKGCGTLPSKPHFIQDRGPYVLVQCRFGDERAILTLHVAFPACFFPANERE
jgi:hypothetical protein